MVRHNLVLSVLWSILWQGDVDVGDEQLCIIHSDADGQLFQVGSPFDADDSGLRNHCKLKLKKSIILII